MGAMTLWMGVVAVGWEGNHSPRDVPVVVSAWTRLLVNSNNKDDDDMNKDMMECCFHGRRRRSGLAIGDEERVVVGVGKLIGSVDNRVFSR